MNRCSRFTRATNARSSTSPRSSKKQSRSARRLERDGDQLPLAGASVRNIENCFIKLDLRFATASGWLERLVRCVFCLECAPDVSVMKHCQKESRWCEKGDKCACTDDQAETWINCR